MKLVILFFLLGLSLSSVGAEDTDGDSIEDAVDICIMKSNVAQADADEDGYGNICDPDFNNNGIVDSSDAAIIFAAFGKLAGVDPDFDPVTDLNSNGVIDSNDVSILFATFGQPPGPSGIRRAVLFWTPPDQNENGTPLTDLTGYEILYGAACGTYPTLITVQDNTISTYIVDGLGPGTYCFVVKAFNSEGIRSEPSNTAEKVIL